MIASGSEVTQWMVCFGMTITRCIITLVAGKQPLLELTLEIGAVVQRVRVLQRFEASDAGSDCLEGQ